MFTNVITCYFSTFKVIQCHSFGPRSCHFLSMVCHITSCHAMSYHVISIHVMPCYVMTKQCNSGASSGSIGKTNLKNKDTPFPSCLVNCML